MIIIIITLCGAGGLCGFGNYGGMICYHDYCTSIAVNGPLCSIN